MKKIKEEIGRNYRTLNNDPIPFDHDSNISASVTDSISQISIHKKTNIPIILGVLTTYDYEQALKRSNPKDKDKGGEVMQAAIDTIKTFNKIKK